MAGHIFKIKGRKTPQECEEIYEILQKKMIKKKIVSGTKIWTQMRRCIEI